MPEGRRPRGVTPRQRSGVAPRVPGCDGAGTAEKSYPSQGQGRQPKGATRILRSEAAAGRSYLMSLRARPGTAAGRSNPTPEARGGGREDQLHVQVVVAARVQEGLEELSHVEGQEGQR